MENIKSLTINTFHDFAENYMFNIAERSTLLNHNGERHHKRNLEYFNRCSDELIVVTGVDYFILPSAKSEIDEHLYIRMVSTNDHYYPTPTVLYNDLVNEKSYIETHQNFTQENRISVPELAAFYIAMDQGIGIARLKPDFPRHLVMEFIGYIQNTLRLTNFRHEDLLNYDVISNRYDRSAILNTNGLEVEHIIKIAEAMTKLSGEVLIMSKKLESIYCAIEAGDKISTTDIKSGLDMVKSAIELFTKLSK